MKVTTDTIETKKHLVDLTEGDLLIVRMDNKIVGMRFSLPRLALEFFPLHEGDCLDMEPTLTLRLAELEAMSAVVDYPVQLISLTIPAKLMPKVKEKLKDLPIVLPTVRRQKTR
jgi:hypothetical protein